MAGTEKLCDRIKIAVGGTGKPDRKISPLNPCTCLRHLLTIFCAKWQNSGSGLFGSGAHKDDRRKLQKCCTESHIIIHSLPA